ncbi:hypothetical protein D3C79_759540 [compost metagenome]
MLDRQALDFVVVDQAGVGVDAVLHSVVQLARGRHLGAVGQVAAVGQAHAEDGVTGLQQGQVDSAVGRRAGVRLDVGVVGTEQLLGALDGQGFYLVHVLAATVVALARVAFGVLVGQAAALGLHDALAGVVLRGDQLDVIFLALFFGIHRRQQCIVVTLDLVLLAEHRVSPGSDRFLSWGTVALCGDVMTGRGGSDACARLAMARLRHSFCTGLSGLIAGKPAPTGMTLFSSPVEYLWEPACRR